MASSRTAWGIDVGNRALKAVRVSREGDGFRIDDIDVIEHETPLSQSGDNRDALVTKALTEFAGRHKTAAVPVGVSVSGQQSFARFIKLPPVDDKELPKIVRFEAIQQIPFPLDDVEWAYQLFKKPDDPEVEVGLFAMRKELVNRHVSFYTDQKLNVQAVQMSPMAVYNAMAFDGRLGQTTLLVDMGADTTDLVIADGEQVWHRSVPIGGNSFTETLVRTFKLDFAKAEEMKRDASSSKYARQIFQAMRPVFADLVSEIQRSIGFYCSTHRDAKIVKTIVMGGTFKLPGLQKYLQQNLQMDVERVESFTAAAPNDQKLLTVYQDNILSCVTAYGLAVQAMGEGKIVSSLLPSHIRREQIWRDKGKWFAASAALFVVGAGVALAGGFLPKLAFESASEDRGRIETAMGQAKDLDLQWSAIESAGETERSLIRNVQSLKSERGLWPGIVATLRDSLPPGPKFGSQAEVEKYVAATPRQDRRVVAIDRWESLYVGDVGPLLSDKKRSRFATTEPVAAVEGGEGGMPSGMPGGLNVPSYVRIPTFSMGQRGGMAQGGPSSGDGELELPPPPADIVTAATGKSGYLLRIHGLTTARDAQTVLDETFIAGLLETRLGDVGQPRDFYVADAFMVKQSPLRENTERINALIRSHAETLRLKGGDAMPTASAGGGGRGPGEEEGGAMNRGPGWMGPGSMGPGSMGPNFGPSGRPPGYPPNLPWPPSGSGVRPGDGGANPGSPAGAGGLEDPTPFLDPVTGEDIRGDSEFMVLVFVVVGNPPPAAGEAAATPPTP